MKNFILIISVLVMSFSFSQEEEQLSALKKADSYIYEGNTLAEDDDFVSAEMAYRKAISEQPTSVSGTYNLGNSYYKKENFDEALYRYQQAANMASSKLEKHNAFHNLGNVLMKNKKCKLAVEAFKNALRNNSTDDETRYNLVLAKECAEQQKDQQDDKDDKDKENKENKDNKDKDKDKEGDNKEDKKDKGEDEKKENEDKKDDEGKPKEEKEDKGKEEENKEQQKPQPGQLSPQQIKNLLEAMDNQEQKVQEKINAEKQKGVKIKTEKDW